jgi:hypothetical protein
MNAKLSWLGARSYFDMAMAGPDPTTVDTLIWNSW